MRAQDRLDGRPIGPAAPIPPGELVRDPGGLGPLLELADVLLPPPAVTRPNRAAIYLNVNGRPVKDRTLTSWVSC